MSTIGPTYLAHIIVSQAEVRPVADETSSATAAKIKSDQNQIEAAQEIEAAEAKAISVNFVTPQAGHTHRNDLGAGLGTRRGRSCVNSAAGGCGGQGRTSRSSCTQVLLSRDLAQPAAGAYSQPAYCG